MTYLIALIVILLIIVLFLLFYSPKQKHTVAQPPGEKDIREQETQIAASPTETEEEYELDLTFEPSEEKTELAEEEHELELSLDKAEPVQEKPPVTGEEQTEQEVPPALAEMAPEEEEETIPLIQEEEEARFQSEEEIAPALSGFDEDSALVHDETPDDLAERLDSFFGPDGEVTELEAEEEVVSEEVVPSESEGAVVEQEPGGDVEEVSLEFGPEEYDAELSDLEQKLRRDLNAAIEDGQTTQLGLLESKLTSVCGKRADMQRSFDRKRKLIKDIESVLESIQAELPGFQEEAVRRHLRDGDKEVVRSLLDEAAAQIAGNAKLTAGIRYLSGCLAEDQAEYQAAFALFQKACAADADNAEYLYKAGRLARILGEDEEALNLLEKFVAVDSGAGETGEVSALAFHELAKVYIGTEQKEMAEPLLQKAISAMESLHGGESPELGLMLHDLAALYESSGRYEEAEPLYRKALEMTEKSLGPGHPYIAPTLSKLAGLYEEMELEDQSGPLYERALEVKKGVVGEEHPDVGTLLNHLGNLLKQQGKYEEAEPLFRRSLEIAEKTLGKDHPNLAVVLNNLAELYSEMGREEEAEQYQERAFALFELPGGGEDFVEMEKDHEIDIDAEKNKTIT